MIFRDGNGENILEMEFKISDYKRHLIFSRIRVTLKSKWNNTFIISVLLYSQPGILDEAKFQ